MNYNSRFKCCFYDNDVKKHFEIIEEANSYSVKRNLSRRFSIPVDELLDDEIKKPGVKYIRIIQ